MCLCYHMLALTVIKMSSRDIKYAKSKITDDWSTKWNVCHHLKSKDFYTYEADLSTYASVQIKENQCSGLNKASFCWVLPDGGTGKSCTKWYQKNAYCGYTVNDFGDENAPLDDDKGISLDECRDWCFGKKYKRKCTAFAYVVSAKSCYLKTGSGRGQFGLNPARGRVSWVKSWSYVEPQVIKCEDQYREKAVSIVDDIIESNKRIHPKINRREFRLGGFCVYKRNIESRDKYFCVTGTESKRVPITASAAIWNLDSGYKNVSSPIRQIFI